MADFHRGNLSNMPTNTGRNRSTAAPSKTKLAKKDREKVAESLLENLAVSSLPMPEHFDEAEQKLWGQVTTALSEANVLSRLDVLVITAWVESWCSYQRLRQLVKEQGETVINSRGLTVPNPVRVSLQSELSLWVRLNQSLGLDPQARVKLHSLTAVVEKAKRQLWETDDTDPFAQNF